LQRAQDALKYNTKFLWVREKRKKEKKKKMSLKTTENNRNKKKVQQATKRGRTVLQLDARKDWSMRPTAIPKATTSPSSTATAAAKISSYTSAYSTTTVLSLTMAAANLGATLDKTEARF
jgi:hypothetical protein